MITNTILGEIHLYSALLSTLFGTIILIDTKGTARHKKIGYAYTVSMLVVNITALMIYRLFGTFGIFHYAAIVSLATLLAGMVPIMINKTNKTMMHHISWMYWSVIGLYGAFVSETLTRIPDQPFYSMLGIAVGIVMSLGALGFNRYKKQWEIKFTN